MLPHEIKGLRYEGFLCNYDQNKGKLIIHAKIRIRREQ
jgi:hypothetical protein